MTRTDRLTHLDGLRGVAALAVVAHHYCLAFAPGMQPFAARAPHWLYDTPLALAYNGSFALAIFFVVSGFVVANAAASGKAPLPVSLIVRYLRLAVPVTVSVLFAYLMLSLFAGAPRALHDLMPRNGWLYQSFWDGPPGGVLAALRHGLYEVFVTGTSKYNNPLWTMRTELIGSAAIFVAYALSRGWARPVAVIALTACALWQGQGQYLAFGLGALLREAWIRGWLVPQGAWPALVAGVLLGAPLQNAAHRFGVQGLPFLGDLGVNLGQTAIMGAALIVCAVLASARLRDVCAARIPAFLGRISFAVYLVHAPLIFSVWAWAYVRAAPVSAGELVAGFIALLAVSLTLAFGMTKAVDEPLVRALSYGRKKGGEILTRLIPRRSDTPGQG